MLTLWIAAVGLCFGSFINVVIARLPLPDDVDEPDPGDSWWEGWKATFRISGRAFKRLAWPPSRCPKCNHQIRWFENIPVVSWLALRGKCSNCKTPISPRYILVELLTGALFVAAFSRFGWTQELLSPLVFIVFLVPLVFIDAEHWILPFELTLPGIALGIGLAIPQGPDAVRTSLIGAVAGFLAFRVMEVGGFLATSTLVKDENGVERRMGREALGAGDKYLLAMIGAQVGWRALLAVILFSSLQGAVVGLIRMRMTGRAGPKDAKTETAPKTEAKPEEAKSEEPKTDAPKDPKPPGATAHGGEPSDDEEEVEVFPFTPSFLAPGLPFWKRLVLVPVTIFFQDIPDSPPPDESTGEIPDWKPGANNIPFGPWLGLAGLQVLLFSPWLVAQLAHTPWQLVANLVLGGT